MSNHLINETSPYLLQHAQNPVNWYPWGEEAFEKAKNEDKPIFLSIGYSTCHWCHVMAHESFEDAETAKALNDSFISIKVDREERPDIDSIYMSVCQAFTGSGGWPTSIFMTPEQKPFFAGTYFPNSSRFGTISFRELLHTVNNSWQENRDGLISSADQIISALRQSEEAQEKGKQPANAGHDIISRAVSMYKQSYDRIHGGFGDAPKFPAPHNLLFLMNYYRKSDDKAALDIVERTLVQMYRGGIFDHIGYGFSRYSTDKYFLIPHFEKMLYDNALLISAYCNAYSITKYPLYREIAEKTAAYIMREMTSKGGGFFCAQDADSEGKEGRYYVFKPEEIISLLGEADGKEFNRLYDITEQGNFKGESIPNLLRTDVNTHSADKYLERVYEYRLTRYRLHLDDKILTSWNGLMIAAMCQLYRISGKTIYLEAAQTAQLFIEQMLCKNDTLYISYRDGHRGTKGLLADYAYEIYALLALYDATLCTDYLQRAEVFCQKAIADFWDTEDSGFFMYGKGNEELIIRPKEMYDGAMPSGNSIMAYNMVRLQLLIDDDKLSDTLAKHIEFLAKQAEEYPAGHAMYLTALSDYLDVPEKIIAVVGNDADSGKIAELPLHCSLNSIIKVLDKENPDYPLKDDRLTFYVCKNHQCMPAAHTVS